MSTPGQWGAQYKCRSCQNIWITFAGPVTCPSCGHNYIDWLNYKDMFGKKPDKAEGK